MLAVARPSCRRQPWGLVALVGGVALVGCAAPPPPTSGRKEVYVEDQGGPPPDGRTLPFPLAASALDDSYVVVRRLETGVADDAQALRDLAGEDAPQGAEEAAAPPPALLVWVGETTHGDVSSCYLGHQAFLRRDRDVAVGVVHRVRLRVVNRTDRALRLPIAGLSLAGEGHDGEPEPLELLGALDDEGRLEEALVVPSGEQDELDAYFSGLELHPRLFARWGLEEERPPGALAAAGRWTFQATLCRRYALADAPLDEVEGRLAIGEPLPPARTRRPAGARPLEARVDALGGAR